MKGRVWVPRSVLESPWYADADPLERNLLWVLAEKANWRVTVTKSGVSLEPGESVTTWSALATRLSWVERGCRRTPTVARVRRAMEVLERAGEVRCTGLKSYGADRSGRIEKRAADLAADPRQWLGLRVTLVRWPFYASESRRDPREAADLPAEGSATDAADTLNLIPEVRDRPEVAAPHVSHDEAVNLWGQILASVQPKVNRQTFNTWLKPTQGLSLSNGTLVVEVPSLLFTDWIGRNYLPLLQERARELGHDGMVIELTARAA